MKHQLILLMAFLCISLHLNAQSWIDVTDQYVNNPRFDNNSTAGWEWESNAGSQTANYEGMEFWNGTYNFHQTITGLTNGKYRISVQGYHRVRDHQYAYDLYLNGTEEINAIFYANEKQQPIVSIYSESLPQYYNSCWTPDGMLYFPDNMQCGAYCFEKGMYNNQLEVDVTDGTLTIGVMQDYNRRSNWTMFDNFKLEYYGKIIPTTSIKLNHNSLELTTGETAQLTATVLPEDATYKAIAWSSSNPDIATVTSNGLITAKSTGTTSIRAHLTHDSKLFASCLLSVKKGEAAVGSLLINEIQVANIDMFWDPSFNYGGWIEVYNPTDKTVSLTDCYITDDKNDLTKFPFKKNAKAVSPHSYQIIWFDHYSNRTPSQVNFKLDYDGGSIYLVNSAKEIICSLDYPEATPRTSYARKVDGGNDWAITATPTPGKSNASSLFYNTRLEAPIVDRDACLFTSPFNVQVTIPSGATLRYTIDGTTPTESNGLVSTNGRFNVNQTTTFRFRLFKNGFQPSPVVTRSYLYEERSFNLPVISIVTDPDHLYDDSVGIYVKGVNGRTGNGQSTPCNWNMDWERPVNFEYITTDGEMVINQEAYMEMCGGWSRAWTPHSFKIKANKVYDGQNFIPYPIFKDKANLKHKTLQIRNGGNDTDSRIKDAALQEIVHSSGLDIDGQECQPVVHFINGQYIGMLNIREPNNKHFVEANYGLDDEEIDQFEMSPDSNYVQKCGTDESFLEWHSLSSNAADNAVYEQICNMVDIDEYINYMAVELYLGGTDWPQNNIKGFKPRYEGGKFRFVLFDLDGTFAASSDVFNTFEWKQYNHTFDYIYDTGENMTGEIKWVTIFLNMLQNDQFRKQFIDTYCLVAGSVFVSERCNAIIDEMASRTEQALSYEGKSPWWTANNLKNSISNRQQTMINALKNYNRMKLSGTTEQKVSLVANIDEARLLVNNLPVPTNKFNGSLFAPITLRAEAPAGYRFIGWASENSNMEQTVIIKRGITWKYYDQGSLDDTGWQQSDYVDNTWDSGAAPLGYYTSDSNNSRGYNTFLDYGEDANNKRPTYYFRKSFNLNYTPSDKDVYTLNYTIDDGMVVYINGEEAARYLMHNGYVSYYDYSSSYAQGNPDSGSLILPASLFKKGNNVIAIEVHNTDNKSSDIYFDVELTSSSPNNSNRSYVSTDEEYTLPTNGNNHSLIACYEKMSDEEIAEKAAAPVRINEVSADNSIYINDHYKKNDWIELYNSTDQPYDVAGLYISDNADKPQKYQIPAGNKGINTVIEPHGYLILWADKLEDINQLHTPFKLAAEGGDVLLSSDEGWSNKISYPSHYGDESVGVYPDGGTNVYLMSRPTFAATNRINSYSAFIGESEMANAITLTETMSGSIRIQYEHNTLLICSANSTWAEVTLYNAAGQQAMYTTVQMSNGQTMMNINNLPQGFYIVRVKDNTNNLATQKIIIGQ